jgi:hypothetical protein
MQPPGAGGEDCLAAGQVVSTGFAVAADEGLIALKGLDPRLLSAILQMRFGEGKMALEATML